MKNLTASVLGALVLTSAFTVTAADPTAAAVRELAKQVVGVIPDQMPGAENDTKARVELGRKLYFEKNLSINGSISCNSCHRVDQNLGGVDNEPTSPGAFGKRGGRNSPTSLNAGFQLAQFWDGRAANLAAQAKGPVLNPIEMAMPTEPEVVAKLKKDQAYPALFKQAFPQAAEPVTYDNYAEAVAAFERTLITRDRFDDFQKGSDQALKGDELKGAHLFLTVGCTTCHNGPVIGGQMYMKLGLVHPYPTQDVGRFEVTKDADDKFKFKVPMLRNIAITGPYFHDGSIKTLEEAVKKMAYHQLDKQLTDTEVKQMVAFLKTLTDKPRAKK
jgi:cytochrome c peroxidase